MPSIEKANNLDFGQKWEKYTFQTLISMTNQPQVFGTVAHNTA